MKIVIRHDLPIQYELQQRRPDLPVRSASSPAETRTVLPAANVLVANNETWDESFVSHLSRGDWVQTTSMGFEAFPVEEFRKRGIKFSNAADNYTETVSEHAFALMLSLARRLPDFVRGQQEHRWMQELGKQLSNLTDTRLTILGLGNIGNAVAIRGQAFGMSIAGVKRHPSEYSGVVPSQNVHPPEELTELLPDTDYLVLSVPLTDETHHMITRETFESLPDSAILVNVARGPVVDQDALEVALSEGEIAAAGIDVFAQEPVPPESQLWDMDNVLLTPHIGGRSKSFVPRFVDFFLKNYENYCSGGHLKNELTEQ